MSHKLTSVRVTVHRGLVKNADVVGKSDPYVVLKLDGKTKKTAVIKDNLEPIWNETLEMQVLSPNPILYIDAFDEDAVGDDDPLGSGILDLGELVRDPEGAIHNVRVPLQLKGKQEGWVELSAVGNARVAREMGSALAAADHFKSIVLTVQSGRGFTKGDIGSKPDPFVVVKTLPNGHSDVFQTKVQDNTSEPIWQESHEFNVAGETDFKIEVYDKDLVGKDLLGEIQVPFSELSLHKGPCQRWIPVFKKKENAGELMLHFVAYSDPTPAAPAVANYPKQPLSQAMAAGTATQGPLSTLKVTVVEGHGLKAKDLIGSIDPYVEILAGTDSYKTKVASGTDPIWGDSHTFDIARNPTHEVEFRVSDKDRLSRDDFIGRAALPIGSITKAETRTLVLHNNSGSATGSIRIALEPFFSLAARAPSPAAAAAAAAPVAAAAALPPPPVAHRAVEGLAALTVLVKEAKELPSEAGFGGSLGKVDPYVKVATHHDTWKTTHKKNTHNPTWDESHTFDMHGQEFLHFEVFDKDTLSKDDFLCDAKVYVSQLPLTKGPVTQWIPLYKTDGVQAGHLYVSFDPRFSDSHPSVAPVGAFAYPTHTEPPPAPAAPREAPPTPPVVPAVAPVVPAAPRGELQALTVLVKEAKELPSEAGFGGSLGKVDPYVKVITRRDTWKTSHKKNTHNPTWGESHTFDVRGEPSLLFEVYDKDTLSKDDFLCDATVYPAQLPFEKGPLTQWIPLHKKNGSQAGQLLVSFDPKFAPAPSDTRKSVTPSGAGTKSRDSTVQRRPPATAPSRPQAPARPSSPPRDPYVTKQMQIAELRRQIEEQRKHNHDLKRYNDHETVRLQNELADHRAELSRSLADIRTEVARRERQRSPSPPRLGSPLAWQTSATAGLPYGTSLPTTDYGYGYRYSGGSPYQVPSALPSTLAYSPLQTSTALPATWSPAAAAAPSYSLPLPAASLPLAYSAAPSYRVSPTRLPSSYLAAAENLPAYTSSRYVY